MAVYKYLSSNSDSYLQATIKPSMGKQYTFDGRFYCQVKKQGDIAYVDIKYSIFVRLLSWTTSSIDVELDIRNILIVEAYKEDSKECATVLNAVEGLSGKMFFLRINNAGAVQHIFNISDLVSTWNTDIRNEKDAIFKIETNPLFSAILSGFVENGLKREKLFESTLFPSLSILSELNTSSQKAKFKDAVDFFIADKKNIFDNEKQAFLAKKEYGENKNGEQIYGFSVLATTAKGVDKVLPFSIQYSTEEVLGTDTHAFISVGIEQRIEQKDISLMARMSSFTLKNIRTIF